MLKNIALSDTIKTYKNIKIKPTNQNKSSHQFKILNKK